MTAGRFAPSPSGDLHIGNLRTAVLAWLYARRTDREFLVRIEDLDRVRAGAEDRQLADLAALGLRWDGQVVRQSERSRLYDSAFASLAGRGLVYECFCTRREILEAPSAPHEPPGVYRGTCRGLSDSDRAARAVVRPAALRLRSDVSTFTVEDELHGAYEGVVDDFVLRRGDGVVAYNFAVVVDDIQQDIDQIVRGEDLLPSAPRQAYLATLLGAVPAIYVHVPVAVNTAGARLAKRDGAVTYQQLREHGIDPLALIAESLGLAGSTLPEILERYDPARLPREPWIFVPPAG